MVPNATSTARCREPIINDLASDVDESLALVPEPEEEPDEVAPAACELDAAVVFEPEVVDAAAAEPDVDEESEESVAESGRMSDTESTAPVVPTTFWYGWLRPSSKTTESIFQLFAAM